MVRSRNAQVLGDLRGTDACLTRRGEHCSQAFSLAQTWTILCLSDLAQSRRIIYSLHDSECARPRTRRSADAGGMQRNQVVELEPGRAAGFRVLQFEHALPRHHLALASRPINCVRERTAPNAPQHTSNTVD
jgi:hypothetical protein